MRYLLTGILFLLATVLQLSAAIFYVDYASGSDSNSGTSAWAPWKHSPGDPSASGGPAARSLAPGDTVLFRGGVTYVLTSSSGIQLKWNGVASQPIVYASGQQAGWGTGLARFTDHNGGNALTAFSAPATAQQLEFRSLEFVRIGGAATLPADTGSPAAPRFGGGIAFPGGAENVVITDCAFRELGYWSNQKPMAASSLNGTGVSAKWARNFKVLKCEFSQIAFAVDLSTATELRDVEISRSSFGTAVIWPLRLPVGPSAAAAASVVFKDCTTQPDVTYTSGAWNGYGFEPATDVASVLPGSSATLYATAVSSPAPAYQWRRNGMAIPGASGATLRLASVSLNDAGVYTAVASNAGGTALSNAAVLAVGSTSTDVVAPMIVAQPLSQVVAAGTAVQFTVVASGSPTPGYQWLKNGAPLSGQTGSSLNLGSVTSNDAAEYSVVISNSAGSVKSTSATLQVTSPWDVAVAPSFQEHPVGQTVELGATVSFSVVASGKPAPSLQWKRNGLDIPGATSATLTLPAVGSTDFGTYHATATNSAGTAVSSTAKLARSFVISPPVFATHPVSVTSAPLATVSFTATASGSPEPTYQWRKDGNPIPNATSPTLTLQSISLADAGSYSVMATNAVGAVVSNAAALTVSGTSTPEPDSSWNSVKTLIHSEVVLTGAPHQTTFTISGTAPRQMLIRAAGPSLRAFGASDVVVNPVLELYRGETMMMMNDNWKGSSVLSTAFAQAGTFPYESAWSLDAAILITLDPGTYGLRVSGLPTSVGLALLEVYQLP